MTDTNFRDRLTTVNESGGRNWVYPKKPVGRFYNARSILSYFLLTFLFGAPFVRLNGHQLLQFDILNRKFIIFGNVFWPQDFYIFGLVFITLVVFVILFTVVYGRVFCGWVCPQTIFMEMVFRKIEYLIEGDYTKQKALDRREWDTDKVLKKTSKHLIFFAISFLIANTFLAYIIGSTELITIITDPPREHLAGLGMIVVFSCVFYFIFAKFREQVCTIVCPYGRLQGVLLDKSSIVVAYDNLRGETRGTLRKNTERTEGDCIDCKQCVQVCPTGIDIREGTQLECINCTACIDACDAIMDRVGMDRGLIRYDSLQGIEEKKPFRFNARMGAYTLVLSILLGIIGFFLINRNDIDATILRTQGMAFKKLEDGRIMNLYNYKIINKTNQAYPLDFRILEVPTAEVEFVGTAGIELPKEGLAEGTFFVRIPKGKLPSGSSEVRFGLFTKDGKMIQEISARFMMP